MEPAKKKFGIGVYGLAGAIFAFVGAVFLTVGSVIWVRSFFSRGAEREVMLFFPLIFIGMGAIFFILGLFLISLEVRKRRRQKRAIEGGQFVYAEVSGVGINTSVNVNGRSPYYVECHYKDPTTGIVHIFRSRDIYFDPSGIMTGMFIPVYVVPGNFDEYYVDVDAVLPKVEQH